MICVPPAAYAAPIARSATSEGALRVPQNPATPAAAVAVARVKARWLVPVGRPIMRELHSYCRSRGSFL